MSGADPIRKTSVHVHVVDPEPHLSTLPGNTGLLRSAVAVSTTALAALEAAGAQGHF